MGERGGSKVQGEKMGQMWGAGCKGSSPSLASLCTMPHLGGELYPGQLEHCLSKVLLLDGPVDLAQEAQRHRHLTDLFLQPVD